MPRRPSSRPTFVAPAASRSEPIAVPAPAVWGSPQYEDAGSRVSLEPPRELGQDAVEALGEARGGPGRAHRTPQVADGGADAGEGVEAAHAVVAQPRLLEEAQEVGVGVLGDDDEVGAERDDPLEVGPWQPDGRRRDSAGHVRHVGVVGPAGHRDQPVGRQHLHEKLVGGEVERGDAERRLGRRHRRGREKRREEQRAARLVSVAPADRDAQSAADAAAEGGVAEHLLVPGAAQVLGRQEGLDPPRHPRAQPRVEARVGHGPGQPEADEVAVRPLAHPHERRPRAPPREGELRGERALVPRAAQERLARRVHRVEVARALEDLTVEVSVLAPEVEVRLRARLEGHLDSSRPGVREVHVGALEGAPVDDGVGNLVPVVVVEQAHRGAQAARDASTKFSAIDNG